jgi:hypothetical protein
MPPDHFKITDTMPLETPAAKKVWVNFVPNIDLGHLIAMLTFLGGLALQWQVMDRRITIIEQKQLVTSEQSAETRSDLKEIKSVINKIGTDLAVQNAMNATRK